MSADRPGGLKWSYFDDDVLAAWVAEMDFGLAPAITAALHDAVDRGLTGYPYPDAGDALAKAAAGFWGRRFGWEVDPGFVYPAPDVVTGVRRAIEHLTPPGSPVVLHTPVYFPFFDMVRMAGRSIVEVPTPRDATGRYVLDLDAIQDAFAAGARSIVLCNPWNPTGRVMETEEIADLIELAKGFGGRVISDEIHGPIVFDGHHHVPAAGIDPDSVVTVTAASKGWNLPGLKAAQVVLTSESDRAIWEEAFTPEKTGVGTFGLIASAAAYAEGEEWLDAVMRQLTTNRALVTERLSGMPGVTYAEPEGTYLAWATVEGMGDPVERLLTEGRVAVSGGAGFGSTAGNGIRINFATDPETLTAILDRIVATIG